MEAKEFVHSLFKGYEETAALADFKEELLGNLNAKIEALVKKGMEPGAAFAKASAELGDVSALADELSLKKRTEVFEEAYMGVSRYMPAGRVAGYVTFVVVALFGIITALLALFAVKSIDARINGSIDWISFFGVLMPFLSAAAAGFTFLGVTQETASMYPMSKKRGAWYAVAAGLLVFGLILMPTAYFGRKLAVNVIDGLSQSTISRLAEWGVFIDGLTGATINNINNMALIPMIGVIIPFILPGIGILVFLGLTEKDRLKPWAKDFRDKTTAREMEMWNDPATVTHFGMFCGAIWIFAVGLFLLLGFVISFKYSWLVFIFATAFQLVIQAGMSKGEKK